MINVNNNYLIYIICKYLKTRSQIIARRWVVYEFGYFFSGKKLFIQSYIHCRFISFKIQFPEFQFWVSWNFQVSWRSMFRIRTTILFIFLYYIFKTYLNRHMLTNWMCCFRILIRNLPKIRCSCTLDIYIKTAVLHILLKKNS